jgi:asparagine synthase (glutamine-hydrolysing)
MYDVLRADRCIAANSLEARVPFGDLDFVNYVMGIHPSLKMKHPDKMGKFLLRMAFELTEKELKTGQSPWLPKEILWREKAAFSDAVGHSMVDYIKEYADANVSDLELEQAKWLYPMGTPFTKESYLYRKIFESFFPNKGKLIKDFWMPNPTWPNCKVSDPSARVLSNYGKSGE